MKKKFKRKNLPSNLMNKYWKEQEWNELKYKTDKQTKKY